MLAPAADIAFSLDASTLVVVATCITTLIGVFLLFVSKRDSVRALAWWGAAYIIGGFSVAFWSHSGGAPGSMSSVLSHAMLLLACGMMWSAARLFHGRGVLWLPMAAGSIVWFLASNLDSFVEVSSDRVILSALIVATYTFLTAFELWRERRKTHVRRWIGIFVPILHGSIFLVPIPLANLLPEDNGLVALASGWIAIFAIEALLYAVGMAFIVLVLAQDRVVHIHKTAAETDLLTGVFNRRAFLAGAHKLMSAQSKRHGEVGVLLFDLDKFKSINDRFGHAVGDDVLKLFAQTASAAIRTSDIFGRFGGEEFAIILPGGIEEAVVVAERVRFAFEVRAVEVSGHDIHGTVSIGVTSAVVPKNFDARMIDEMLMRADTALYRAKENGRNRIEISAPVPEWQSLPDVASPVLAPVAQDASQDVVGQPA
jgi:diguanylate cyclase (GGDEF)-like protein